MAEVWVATDTQLSRRVAVKLLKPHLASDPIVAERFRREAIAVARLSHQNIVAVHDTVDDGGRQAVVMQYVAGKSLRELLDEQHQLGADLTIHVGMSVASALDEAHRAGLVHRDVKPGNILLTPDGRVLLTDFGIAKAIDESDGHDLTSDNIMMGTAKYLSPEQVRGRRLDGRADLYSLGLVLYECLAGRVPFLGESDADTALARLQRDPTDLGQLRPNIPRGLVDVVHHLLRVDPDARPADGAAVRAALNRVLSGADERTTQAPRPANPRSGPRDATPAIPGEPLAATDAPPPRRTPDRTPPAARAPRAAPSRRLQQRWTPSLVVVGGLLLAALVTGAVLWATVGQGGDVASDQTTPATNPGEAAIGDTSAPDLPVGPAAVVGLRSYDPNGDGDENDTQLALLTDGQAETAWTTVCYADRYLGSKQGVGVVVELDRAATGQVQLDLASAPWQVRLYAADEVPADLAGWGDYLASDFAAEPRSATLQFDRPSQFLLVWLAELGRSPACSSDNPYRGEISRLDVSASG
jgi:serine/threonine-protein kinase